MTAPPLLTGPDLQTVGSYPLGQFPRLGTLPTALPPTHLPPSHLPPTHLPPSKKPGEGRRTDGRIWF